MFYAELNKYNKCIAVLDVKPTDGRDYVELNDDDLDKVGKTFFGYSHQDNQMWSLDDSFTSSTEVIDNLIAENTDLKLLIADMALNLGGGL